MNFQKLLGNTFEYKEISQEQVDLWNSYLVIDPYENPFDYLDELLLDLINGSKQLSVKELNYLGGRYGRKTHEVCAVLVAKLMAVAIKYDFKIAIYGFRKLGADIKELAKEINDALNDIGLEPRESKKAFGDYIFTQGQNIPEWKFSNKSFIQLKGLYKTGSSQIALKGLASCKKFDLSITIYEEANEIKENETQAVEFAVRGSLRHLRVKMSNPDSKFQDYVKYCNDRVVMNKDTLTNKGQQFKVIVENNVKKVFHYTNHKINPFMTLDEYNKFRELEKLDPIKYDIWGIGMPGGLETAIFARYLEQAQNNNIKTFRATSYRVGIDLGQADTPTGHPTSAILVGFNEKGQVKPLSQYFHNNSSMVHKTPNEIATDIVNFCIDKGNEYPDIKRSQLLANVDYGAGGLYMIDILDSVKASIANKNNINLSWLRFAPVDKSVWFIKDRIDATIIMINRDMLMLDYLLTPQLIEQMSLMEWKKPSSNTDNYILKPLDKNDDSWDSLCYAIMEELDMVLHKKENSLMTKKVDIWRLY